MIIILDDWQVNDFAVNLILMEVLTVNTELGKLGDWPQLARNVALVVGRCGGAPGRAGGGGTLRASL